MLFGFSLISFYSSNPTLAYGFQFRLMRDLYETYALKSNVRPIDDDWNPYASVGLEE